jgi:hypothetical protein
MWIHPRKALAEALETTVPVNLQLLGLFLALNLADVVMTHVNVTAGISYEANPVIRALLEQFGWSALYLFKVAGPIILSGLVLTSRTIVRAHWFSVFLCALCVISLTGVCSGVYVLTLHWL